MAEELGFDRSERGTMDYAAHDRTYAGFLWFVKNGSIAVVAIVIFMLAWLIIGAGLLTSLFATLAFGVLAYFIMK